MGRWCSRRILALVFGHLLAVGTVVPPVQAGDMAPDLTPMYCVDATGAICCGDCGGDDGDEDWQLVSNAFDGAYVLHFAVAKTESRRLYAVTLNPETRAQAVLVSEDRGVRWTSLAAD